VGLTSLEAGRQASSRDCSTLDATVSKPLRRGYLEAAVSALFAREDAHETSNRGDSRTAIAGLQVLLAEDNPVNQLLITHILEQRGISVQCVGDGGEAVQAATKDRFDLILMDIQMPGVDGLAATTTLRRREAAGCLLVPEARARVPIVALTAHSMEGDRDRYLAAGMDGYISKPIQVEELLNLISHLCGRGNEVKDIQCGAVSAE
jgi:CheY-like chemotaxis protein